MDDRDFFRGAVLAAIAAGKTPEEAIEIAEQAMFMEKAYWCNDEFTQGS